MGPAATALTADEPSQSDPVRQDLAPAESALPDVGTQAAQVETVRVDAAPAAEVEVATSDAPATPDQSVTTDDAVTLDTADAAGRLRGEIAVPGGFQTVGATWPAEISADIPELQIRTRALDGTWGSWTHLEANQDGPDSESAIGGTQAAYVGASDAVQVATVDPARSIPDGVELAFVSSQEVASGEAQSAGTMAAAERINAPTIVTREEWGAAPQCANPGSGPTWFGAPEGLKGAIVHHTVNPNDYSTPAQAMQAIRNDQAYHQESRGWCDIGYNFLVDKWGNIYEGADRSIEQPIIGAHAAGFNTSTVGVAMIGTFTSVTPPAAMRGGVAKIAGFRLAQYGMDPEATATFTNASTGARKTLPRVFGHRDVGVTECPGNLGYPQLGTIRAAAGDWAQQYADAGLSGTTRVAGATRYETSAAISRATFAAGVPVAYVASGVNFPDALSAAAAAGTLDGPVLLTRPDSIPSETAAELNRLNPARIVVVGGRSAVSSGVQSDLAAYSSNVSRLQGADRWATSAAISAATFQPGVDVAFVANGRNFPDALSGAAAAGVLGGPVLLVEDDEIPPVVAEELRRLAPDRIVVLGSTSVVSTEVETQLAQLTAGGTSRLGGRDRWATSAAISAQTFQPGVDVVYLANGRNFPDALSGAAAAGALGGPVLLTSEQTLPSAVAAELDRLDPARIVVLGGSGAVFDTVQWKASGYVVR
jgi:putative cell wall-binding protein